MPLILDPEPRAADLHGRLDDFRRRLRRNAAAAGGFALTASVVGFVALVCWLDTIADLPAVIRAYLLASFLVGGVWLVRRLIVVPWRSAGDELAMALRVESGFPELAESLASTVQFEREAESISGSAQLRRATSRFAVQRSLDLDFRDLVDGRLVRQSLLACVAAFLMAAPLYFRPHIGLMLTRLADPYGNHSWPPKTSLRVDAPEEIARGEPFELDVSIDGVIPDRATFRLALDGAPAIEHSYALTAQPDSGHDHFVIKLEPGRVPRSFGYQLTANDSTTGWRTVAVRIPPQLAALDGRPTPLMYLQYPRYTDLPDSNLPDGAGAVEAVLGTTMHIRAATDRPVVAASIAYRSADPRVFGTLAGLPFAATDATSALGYFPAMWALAAPKPMTLETNGNRFAGTLVPLVNGNYELRFLDASGLAGHRPLEVRVLADPSPGVSLERPAAATDSLELLPGTSFRLKARIEDVTYAIRKVALEYRTQPGDPPRRLSLYDGDALAAVLPKLLGPAPPMRLKPAMLQIDREYSLKGFRHLDGRPLAVGDVLTLAVAAEDFDDVSPNKPPGRSHEVDLRIVGPDKIEANAQKSRGELATGLRDVLTRQIEARRRAAAVDNQRRSTGQLRPEDVTALGKIEAEQQLIQERLGDDRDGLRAKAEQYRRSLAENPTSSAATRDRAEQIAHELGRLSQDVLEPVVPLLAAARKEPDPVPPADRSAGPLPEAVRRQTDAERSLRELVELAEAGNASGALAAEASALAADQKQLQRNRTAIAERIPPGANPAKLPTTDRDSLNQLRQRQESLGQKASEMTQKLDARAEAVARAAQAETAQAEELEKSTAQLRDPKQSQSLSREADAARDKAESLKREAEGLAAARQAAHGSETTDEGPVGEQMAKAAEAIGENRLGEAQRRQDSAAHQLDRIRDALREPTEPDIERLVKDRRRADEEVERLTKQQESLQDRTLAAEQLADAGERKKQLQQLAREQEQLAERARDAARELSRQRQTDAARDMERAARAMELARANLDEGRPAVDPQDDALDRLDDAAKKTEQARADVEERLQREKQFKFSEQIRGFADRQAALAAEGERLFQAARAAKGWSRSLQKSLADIARDESSLAKELEKATSNNLEQHKVFKHLAMQAAGAMTDVNIAIEDARANGLTPETLDADRAAVRKPQDLAARRLKQLYAAVTPPKEKPPEPGESPQGKPAAAADSPARPPAGEMIPPIAQLQVLRDLQAELNDRTSAFAKDRPDPTKWSAADRAELDALRRAQAELGELMQELTPDPPAPKGKK